MLDPVWLREHSDEVRDLFRRRNATCDYDGWLALDREVRARITELEALQAHRNAVSKEIGRRKGAKENADDLLAEMKELGVKFPALEAAVRELEARRDTLGLDFPNRLHPTTPDGKTSADNPVLRTWGEPAKFDFKPKPHWELGSALGILDLERAAKLAGARYAILSGAGARLERALTQFMLDLQTERHGYREVWPPLLVNAKTLTGTGQLPKFAADLFKMEGSDAYLIPTAEVPLANLHAGEILPEETLPLKLTAFTPCFRAEAGAAGKDTRGVIRQHQFDKVELIKLCTPEQSDAELETLTADAEKVLQLLELPYRVVALCSADLGFASLKTYDLEVWLPGQNDYREISSCSNCGDFQARRMALRCRAGKGKPRLAHTLNGSGLAVGRTWLAVLENGQQADGSIRLPAPLAPYLGGKLRITPEGLCS